MCRTCARNQPKDRCSEMQNPLPLSHYRRSTPQRIDYKQGDLLEAPERIIAHGCNTRGAFNAGVAGAIRRRLPKAYDAYARAHSEGRLKLGSVIWSDPQADPHGRYVAHCITQRSFGRSGHRYVDYDAVLSCMRQVAAFAKARNVDTVAMPAIGAGLGGGDWAILEEIIAEAFVSVRPVVYLLDGRKPAGSS